MRNLHLDKGVFHKAAIVLCFFPPRLLSPLPLSLSLSLPLPAPLGLPLGPADSAVGVGKAVGTRAGAAEEAAPLCVVSTSGAVRPLCLGPLADEELVLRVRFDFFLCFDLCFFRW